MGESNIIPQKKTQKKKYAKQWIPLGITRDGAHAWVYEGKTVTTRSPKIRIKISSNGGDNQMLIAFKLFANIYDIIEFEYPIETKKKNT